MKIVKCDRCGADISHQYSAAGGFTTKRKLAIMLVPEEFPTPGPNANSIVDLCETCDNQIYDEIFVNRNKLEYGDKAILQKRHDASCIKETK